MTIVVAVAFGDVGQRSGSGSSGSGGASSSRCLDFALCVDCVLNIAIAAARFAAICSGVIELDDAALLLPLFLGLMGARWMDGGARRARRSQQHQCRTSPSSSPALTARCPTAMLPSSRT